MAPRLFVVVGLLIAATGAVMLGAPALGRRVLRIAGIRWPPGPYARAAAWLLVILGLAIAFLGRVLR